MLGAHKESDGNPHGERGILVGYDDSQGPLLAKVYFPYTRSYQLHDNGYIKYQTYIRPNTTNVITTNNINNTDAIHSSNINNHNTIHNSNNIYNDTNNIISN